MPRRIMLSVSLSHHRLAAGAADTGDADRLGAIFGGSRPEVRPTATGQKKYPAPIIPYNLLAKSAVEPRGNYYYGSSWS